MPRLFPAMILSLLGATTVAQESPDMRLSSPAFEHGDAIPEEHTCEGDDLSPPLSWLDPPDGTRSLALIVDDPDAPDPAAPKMTWVHWVVYNIPPEAGGLSAGAGSGGLPEEARHGLNNWGRADYGGPCPPAGEHRYFHKLYALDTRLDLDRPDKKALLVAMEGHVLGRAELVGVYEKKR